MAGTCITTIKYLGVGVLGLTLLLIIYQTYEIIPRLIREVLVLLDVVAIKKKVTISLIIHTLAGAAASLLFYTAYKYSPSFEKHPYLIYSGLCLVAVAIGVWYGYPVTRSAKPAAKPVVAKKAVKHDEPLDKLYVHVSDEDLSVISTPSSTSPNSPQLDSVEDTKEIDDVVALSVAKHEAVVTMESISLGYLFAGIVGAVGTVLGLIGIAGDAFAK